MHMFRKDVDFEAFERVMVDAHERQPIRVLSYCVWNTRFVPKAGHGRRAKP